MAKDTGSGAVGVTPPKNSMQDHFRKVNGTFDYDKVTGTGTGHAMGGSKGGDQIPFEGNPKKVPMMKGNTDDAYGSKLKEVRKKPVD